MEVGTPWLSSVIIFPLEVIKVRLQASPKDYYKGVRNVIFKIYTEEHGIRSFYKGVHVGVMHSIPSTGLNLATYDTFKRLFVRGREVKPVIYMFIGAFSAFVTSSLLYPFQTASSRIIMAGLECKNMTNRQVIGNMIFKEGIGAFYKGYTPGMTKIVLGNGIGFFTYESCKIAFKVK